jgi:hypothetical protein
MMDNLVVQQNLLQIDFATFNILYFFFDDILINFTKSLKISFLFLVNLLFQFFLKLLCLQRKFFFFLIILQFFLKLLLFFLFQKRNSFLKTKNLSTLNIKQNNNVLLLFFFKYFRIFSVKQSLIFFQKITLKSFLKINFFTFFYCFLTFDINNLFLSNFLNNCVFKNYFRQVNYFFNLNLNFFNYIFKNKKELFFKEEG